MAHRAFVVNCLAFINTTRLPCDEIHQVVIAFLAVLLYSSAFGFLLTLFEYVLHPGLVLGEHFCGDNFLVHRIWAQYCNETDKTCSGLTFDIGDCTAKLASIFCRN